MIVELDLNQETVFILEMEIEGGDEARGKSEMRFCVEFDDYTLTLKAKKIEDGVYEIKCPKLKGLAEIGTYTANVEVFIDDKRFIPLTETVVVKQELKPVVKLVENKSVKPIITVKSGIKPELPLITKTNEIIRK